MSLSSFCVVSNALRLNLVKLYQGTENTGSNGNHRSENRNEKKNEKMTKTLVIEGMMCGHCEARVKKRLEGMEEISEAVVSHEV